MRKIIIYVSGGVIQDIISNSDDVEVMVVDYDNERYTTNKDRVFEVIRKDHDYFDQTIERIEI